MTRLQMHTYNLRPLKELIKKRLSSSVNSYLFFRSAWSQFYSWKLSSLKLGKGGKSKVQIVKYPYILAISFLLYLHSSHFLYPKTLRPVNDNSNNLIANLALLWFLLSITQVTTIFACTSMSIEYEPNHCNKWNV